MTTGFFAGYIDTVMQTPTSAPDLQGDSIVATLWTHAVAPDANELDTIATKLISDTTGGIAAYTQTNHFEALANKVFTTAFIFDADNSVVALATAEAVPKSIMLHKMSGAAPVAGDQVIAFFDLSTNAVSPNGQDITITWNSSGIFKLGGHA
jgi:hypothetical protein